MRKETTQIELVQLKCNLKKILESQNVSVNFLSKEINERRSTLNDLVNNKEMDKRMIPARIIAKLCCYLDVDICELFTVTYKDNNN